MPCGRLTECSAGAPLSNLRPRFIIHAAAYLARPSTTARLEILSPRSGEVFHGNPADVAVHLRLDGGKITPVTSLHLIPNEGHIHLHLDGSLVSMSGLDTTITAGLGQHTLQWSSLPSITGRSSRECCRR